MAFFNTASIEETVENLNLHSKIEEEKTDVTAKTILRTPHVSGKHRFSRFPGLGMKNPPPPKASIDDPDMIPEATASWFSLLTFSWITPLLSLGYARPLEVSDLYKLQDSRSASYIAGQILASFHARQDKADEYNARLAKGEVKAGLRIIWWTLKGDRARHEKHWREVGGKRKASLALAMNESVKWWFWSSGLLKIIADTAQITSPLVIKAIINFATESYTNHRVPGAASKVPPISKGVGLTFTLLVLQLIASFAMHHSFYRSMSTGVLLRGGLITAIYKRSLSLSSRARLTLTNGKLVNHISTDVSRIDFCCGFFHMSWAAVIQLVICLILLLLNLGPSALPGFAFFVLTSPVQTITIKRLMAFRRKSMMWTDKRIKLLQELLGGMKVIKFFSWETPFLRRIFSYRQREMVHVRSLMMLRSGNNAFAMTMPILAAVMGFVTYSLTGHDLDPAIIFSSLSLFQLLRIPLMTLPISLSAITDAANATERLYEVFEAETLDETQIHDTDIDSAIEVEGAEFMWDSQLSFGHLENKQKNKKRISVMSPIEETHSENVSFRIKEINLSIPRGKLFAIVGPVGAGKSSLLQGLIGEMRRTSGSVKFGGSVSYCPQNPWIQNATIRENICFGRPFEANKYWKAVKGACLEPDLDMLAPTGDFTEVGERGISLSGGQKQRVNIARAIYCDTDVQIFDDPLSALDAHVGKAVFENVLRNGPSGKTRILVTHALHLLPQVDYILTMVDGRIAERGTYAELLSNNGEFSKFVTEFGAQEDSSENDGEAMDDGNVVDDAKTDARQNATSGSGMMQTEERNTGKISGAVYRTYLHAGNGIILVPLLILSVAFMQGATIMSSYWLIYWQEKKWNQTQGFYIAIYACLGVFQTIFMFLMSSMLALFTNYASQKLHKAAIERVMHAPMSFFETTPLGRIMNRFSKDIDTIDNPLGDAMRMFITTLSAIFGAIALISILLPWFTIGVLCILIIYIYTAIFYRTSARELIRLDAILRSSLYSHFSESLSGLATIRAYGEANRFRLENEQRMDIENRAYMLTIINQRWLGICVDFLSIILTFVAAILCVATRYTISPAQTGIILTYVLSIQQGFSWLMKQGAEVDNCMSSVERIVHYATETEQEAPHDLPDKSPLSPWPAEGRIELKDVILKYRPELPPVLRGLSISIQAGEKIGIVGRTGAGKSSLMIALYRLVELTSGSISIDGVDISTLGLADLRRGLSIIPQDALLFSGTLRSNLDPFGLHEDVRLWDALKRSYLVESDKDPSLHLSDGELSDVQIPINRFTLDSPVEDEGSNLSIGQRSLVSLARALVKNTKILILDEATASVDYETDRRIQDTIQTELQDRTILCIAHRLRTIISYDRVCVLDAGQIAEFDTPLNLYAKSGGIFRTLCDQSSIVLDDIRHAAKLREAHYHYV